MVLGIFFAKCRAYNLAVTRQRMQQSRTRRISVNQGIRFSPSQPNVSFVDIDSEKKSEDYGLPSYEDAVNMNKY